MYTLQRITTTVKPGATLASFKDMTKREHVSDFLSMNDDEAARFAVSLVSHKFNLKLSYPRTGGEARAILKRHNFSLFNAQTRKRVA